MPAYLLILFAVLTRLALAATPHPEVEDHIASRFAILPQKSLMVLPAPVRHLHRNRRFIRLYVASGN